MTARRSKAFSLVLAPCLVSGSLALVAPLLAAGCGSDLDVGTLPPAKAEDAGAPGSLLADGGTGDGAPSLTAASCEDGGSCGEVWTESARITLDQTAAGALFGASLARDGDDLFVGAPCEGGSASNGADGLTQCPGGVHVFHKFGGTWVPEQWLNDGDPLTVQGRFGTSVATLDGTLFVGQPGFGGWGVVTYTRSGDGWQYVGPLGDEPIVNDGYQSGLGRAIVAGGDLVAVGWANGVDLFRQVNGVWTYDVGWTSWSTMTTGSTPLFALDGDRLFVTDIGEGEDGGSACSVKVYAWTPGTLTQTQSIEYPIGECGSSGLLPFAVDGARLAVGHYASDATAAAPTLAVPTVVDIYDQPASGGDYALTTSIQSGTADGCALAGMVGLAGNEAVWMTASSMQLFAGSGTSWAAAGPSVPLPEISTDSSNLVNTFVMTSDEVLVGSPYANNFGQLAGTVESFGVSDAGLVPSPLSAPAVDPVQLLTGAEVLGGLSYEAPTSVGIGTLVAAAPGLAVVTGVDTGFYALEEVDAGSWQLGGALVPTSGTGSGAAVDRVEEAQAAVAGGTIALATSTDVFLFQKNGAGWAEWASLPTAPLSFVSPLGFDGTTLAGVCSDSSDGSLKVCLVDTTSQALTVTTLPYAGPACYAYSVSLGGGTLLVASAQCDDEDISQTKAYVFERSSSGWSPAPPLDVAPGMYGNLNDVYGVVTDGKAAAISAAAFQFDPGANTTQAEGTVATFFSLESGVWQETQSVPLKSYQASNLVLDGDVLYVSAPSPPPDIFVGPSGSETAYGDVLVCQRVAGDWSNVSTVGTLLGLTHPISFSPPFVTGFGTSIALAGHELLVGSPEETVGGKLGWGSVYVFDHTGPTSGPTP